MNKDNHHGKSKMIYEKPWGREIIWARTSKYVGKILEIKNGHRLSLQFHEHKEETLLVSEGILTIEVHVRNEHGQETSVKVLKLAKGGMFHVAPGTVHRLIAAEGDVKVIEVSTPELHDVVRLADDYGRIDAV